jgi:hypothetical protein
MREIGSKLKKVRERERHTQREGERETQRDKNLLSEALNIHIHRERYFLNKKKLEISYNQKVRHRV